MSKPIIFHLSGDMTIVVEKDDKGYRHGISFCHPNDNFSRRIGRIIAEGRVGKSPVYPDMDAMGDAIIESIESVNDVREFNATRRIGKEIENYIHDAGYLHLIAHIKEVVAKVQ